MSASEKLVERVARAICDGVGVSYDDMPENATYIERKSNPERAFCDRQEARDVARAAIAEIREALSEPTPDMIEDGVLAYDMTGISGDMIKSAEDHSVFIFQAMLAASPLSKDQGNG